MNLVVGKIQWNSVQNSDAQELLCVQAKDLRKRFWLFGSSFQQFNSKNHEKIAAEQNVQSTEFCSSKPLKADCSDSAVCNSPFILLLSLKEILLTLLPAAEAVVRN